MKNRLKWKASLFKFSFFCLVCSYRCYTIIKVIYDLGYSVTRPEMKGLKTDSLRVDCLTEKPRDYDWSDGYLNGWEVVQPFFYEDFDEPEADNTEETGYYSFCDMEESNYPMMNYYYPLPSRDSFGKEEAQKINHLNLCIIRFEDEEYALALTGGGMDFSWQICEAHIRLGYYPPVHFRLPNMAGKEASQRNLAIVDACIKGREIVKNWQTRDIEELERTRDRLSQVRHSA